MANVHYHPEAQEEYEAAVAWYYSRSPDASLRFEAEVDRISQIILANPELYARYDNEHRFAVLRRFPYSLAYSVQGPEIFVVAVAHSSRLPGYWKGRR